RAHGAVEDRDAGDLPNPGAEAASLVPYRERPLRNRLERAGVLVRRYDRAVDDQAALAVLTANADEVGQRRGGHGSALELLPHAAGGDPQRERPRDLAE